MAAFLLPSIPPCFPCCNASYPYSRVYRPHLGRCPAQFALLPRVYIETAAWGTAWTANSAEMRPIHAGGRVRSVTTRETGRDTSEEEMPPFPLALGFNAAFPPCSRVQLIARVAPRRAPSRVVGPPMQAFLSRVVTQVSMRTEERAFACKIHDWGPLTIDEADEYYIEYKNVTADICYYLSLKFCVSFLPCHTCNAFVISGYYKSII